MTIITGGRMGLEASRQAALSRAIARTQAEISTGKRIERASDDPAAAGRVAELVRSTNALTGWHANIALAQSLVGQADTVLGQLVDRLTRAHELVVSAGNGGLNAADRQNIGQELRAIADDVAGQALLRNSLDEPLFPTDAAPVIPIGAGETLVPVPSAGELFSPVGGALVDRLRAAAAVVELVDPALRAAQYAPILADVTAMGDHASAMRAMVGVTAARLDVAAERLDSQKLSIATERSGLEDTDIGEAMTRLSAQQLTLEAAQAAFARIHRRTLFDILG